MQHFGWVDSSPAGPARHVDSAGCPAPRTVVPPAQAKYAAGSHLWELPMGRGVSGRQGQSLGRAERGGPRAVPRLPKKGATA